MDGERSKESSKNRKIEISNLSNKVNIEDMKKELFYSQNFKVSHVSLSGNSAFVTLANNSEARRAAKLINGQLFKGKRITVTLAPTSSSSAHSGFLVVGNLPFDYSEDQFRKLMTPHGEIKRLFLVRNKNTGQSKGYGFVEYTKKEHAVKAKEHFTTSNAKFVNNRIIRVDIATGNQLNGKDQHSKTLFIDHLPKSFDDEGYLEDLFRKTGRVAFCKIAFNNSGVPRGFAFVDYGTVEEAEQSQEYHDGTRIGDSNIRVTFCTPGKCGRDILGKFEDQMNNRDGIPRAPLLFPGMDANLMGPPRGPMMPPVGLGTSPNMLPSDILRSPMESLLTRAPLRLPRPYGANGLGGPHLSRPPVGPLVGPPVGPVLGPSVLGPSVLGPSRFPGPNMVDPQGPRLRVPVTPPQNPRLMRPKTMGNLRKNSPYKASPSSSSLLHIITNAASASNKNKYSWKATGTVKEKQKEKKEEKGKSFKEKKNDKSSDKSTEEKKEEEKEEPSDSVSLSELQKIGASALAAAMNQTTSDSGNVKVLQPVVFMDPEQFRQFQEFQELMKQQKESGSGDVSMQELVKAQQTKQEPKQPQNESRQVRPEPPAPVPAQAVNETPEKQATSIIKEERIEEKPKPTTPATTRHAGQQKEVAKEPPSRSTPQEKASRQTEPVQRGQLHQNPQQSAQSVRIPQTKPSPRPSPQQEQRKPYERDRNGESYHESTKSRSPVSSNTSPAVTPLKPPPQIPYNPQVLKSMFPGSNKRPLDAQNPPISKLDASVDQRAVPGNEAPKRNKTGGYEYSPSDTFKSVGPNKTPPTRAPTRGIPVQPLQSDGRQQYQSTEEKEHTNVPRRSPANDRENTQRDAAYNRSRYAYDNTIQRDNVPQGQSPLQRYDQGADQYPPDRHEKPPMKEERSPYDQSPSRDTMPPPSRGLRALRDAVASRDLRSIRDMVPSQESPLSRDSPKSALPPRERPLREFPPYDSLPRRDPLPSRNTFPPRDSLPPRHALPPRNTFPPRDSLPLRDSLPPRDSMSKADSMSPRDPHRDSIAPRSSLPPRAPLLPRSSIPPRGSLPPRESLPPRDVNPRNSTGLRDSPRDIYPPRNTLPSRETRPPREVPASGYDREVTAYDRERAARMRLDRESPSARYLASEAPPRMGREAVDRARYDRAPAAEKYDQRDKDIPRYEREALDSPYRGLPPRATSIGNVRGPLVHYPMEGPASKRPRY